jgi:hypothetical protein
MNIFEEDLLNLSKFNLIYKVVELNKLLDSDFYKLTVDFPNKSVTGIPINFFQIANANSFLYLIEQVADRNVFHHIDINQIDHISLYDELLLQSVFKKSPFDESIPVPSRLELNKKLKSILQNLKLENIEIKIEMASVPKPEEFLSVGLIIDEIETAFKKIIDSSKKLDLKLLFNVLNLRIIKGEKTSVQQINEMILITSSVSEVVKQRHKNIKHLIEETF